MTGSVVTLGETMALLTTPPAGRITGGTGLTVGIGGAESNVAIALARLDVPCTWISRVGDDALGALVVKEIRGEGVDVVVRRDDAAPTGMMLKELRGGRPWRVRYYRRDSAASRLSPDDVDEPLIASAAVLHLTGITPALGPGRWRRSSGRSPWPARTARWCPSTSTTGGRCGPTRWRPRCSRGWRRRPTSCSRDPPKRRWSSTAAGRLPTRRRSPRGPPRPPGWLRSGPPPPSSSWVRSARWHGTAASRSTWARERSRSSTRSARGTPSSAATWPNWPPAGPSASAWPRRPPSGRPCARCRATGRASDRAELAASDLAVVR